MPTFAASDGTQLAYRTHGSGDPLVCIPGGPTDATYFGDLGGLSVHRQLILMDLRGTGRSALPDDVTSYRCDHLVDDVEALREHLGLTTMALLGHSAGTNIAVQYAARHPKHVDKLVLICPSTAAVGITITAETRHELALLRKDEPWFPAAFAALTAITEGIGTDWSAIAPFFWGRWDAAAQNHPAARTPSNADAVAHFAAEGAFDPAATRAALADYETPVLLLAGEVDLNSPPTAVAEFASLFPDAELVVQPGAGHYPWLDDADRFMATVAAFLR
jgi:pimeloyl-ACP methyl ester carboxylesterase